MRITDELRTELNTAANEEGRSMSNIAERVLIDWAAQRVVRRARTAGGTEK
jgi:hypothetical protein